MQWRLYKQHKQQVSLLVSHARSAGNRGPTGGLSVALVTRNVSRQKNGYAPQMLYDNEKRIEVNIGASVLNDTADEIYVELRPTSF